MTRLRQMLGTGARLRARHRPRRDLRLQHDRRHGDRVRDLELPQLPTAPKAGSPPTAWPRPASTTRRRYWRRATRTIRTSSIRKGRTPSRTARARRPIRRVQPCSANTCSPYTWTYDGGTTTMWGWFDTSTSNWTITSTGSVRNAFGGAATTRTLTATVHIRTGAVSGQLRDGVELRLRQGHHARMSATSRSTRRRALSISLYVEGNLCFKNSAESASRTRPTRSCLEVRGKLVWLSGASKGVGDA